VSEESLSNTTVWIIDTMPEPEIVYHYAAADTLMKIVRSGSVWATNVEYLNDTSEIEHFLQLVRARLPEFFKERGLEPGPYWLDDREAFDLGKWFTPPEERLPLRSLLFVASFSREADSLPQWRSYCSDGNGVSIGFNVDKLKRGSVLGGSLANDPSCFEFIDFEAIEYVDNLMSASIDSAISEAIDEATTNDYCVGLPLSSEERRHAVFNGNVGRLACVRKHVSFSAEREYRLIVQPTAPPASHVLEFRPTRSTLVPFVIVHLENPFIDHVVVGPTANMDLSLQAVSAFLRRNSISAPVVPSTIPFRDVR
jgi:hypothetical protein